jgi:hypothetical protein
MSESAGFIFGSILHPEKTLVINMSPDLLNCCHVPDLIPRPEPVASSLQGAKCLRVCFTIINETVPENFQKLPTKNLAHVCTISF